MENWEGTFLAHFRSTGLIASSAKAAGVSSHKVNARMKADEEFSFAVEEAAEIAADRLELEARRRGVEGVPEDVYYRGEVVGEKTNYSDTLLSKLLDGRRPSVFRAKAAELNLNAGITVTVRSFEEAQGRIIEVSPVFDPSKALEELV